MWRNISVLTWPGFTTVVVTFPGCNPQPVTNTLSRADWVICAINTRGQQRHHYANFNRWCCDGASFCNIFNLANFPNLYPPGAVPPRRLSYFACRIDFNGSPGPAKRSQVPIGHFGGELVYVKFTFRLAFSPVQKHDGTRNANLRPVCFRIGIEWVYGPTTTITIEVLEEDLPRMAMKIREEVFRASSYSCEVTH
ncbi:hypothetical protein GQ53DRAFT_745887 [Thozetella sp. PMI_491]|nr:hypothetical protein GQ53DRAFT_745887 [Thozetella sp. PMI_491]